MKKMFRYVLVTCISIMTITSCSSDYNPENLVPENAIMAIKVDVGDLYKKSFEDNDVTKKLIAEIRKGVNEIPDAEIKGLYNNALDNPVEAYGLDLDEPVIISVTHPGKINRGSKDLIAVYAAMAISDYDVAKKFVDRVYQAAKADSYCYGYPTSKSSINDDVEFYHFGYADGVMISCALSEDFLLFYMTEDRNNADRKAKTAIEDLLSQKNPCSAPGFEDFIDADNSVDFWMNIEAVANIGFNEIKGELYGKNEMAAMLMKSMLNGMAVNGYLDFDEGKTEMGMKMHYSDAMKEQIEKFYQEPSSKFLELLPAETVCAFNVAINNAGLQKAWDDAMKNPLVQMYMGEAAEFGVSKSLISGLPGTITFGCAMNDDDGVGDAVLAVECDKNAYKTVMRLLENEGMAEDMGNGYSFVEKRYDYMIDDYRKEVLAYAIYNDDKECAVIMTPSVWKKSNGGKNIESNYHKSDSADDIEDGGFVFDFTKIRPQYMRNLLRGVDRHFTVSNFLDFMASIVLTYDEDEVDVVWNMGDQDRTILQAIVNFAGQNI